MAGPWRVRFVLHDDPVWRRLIAVGLIPDGGTWDIIEAIRADRARVMPARIMAAAGGWMPWPLYKGQGDGPNAPPLGAHVFCPQCGEVGSIGLRHDPRYLEATWKWNCSTDRPTLHPSIRQTTPDGCDGHWWLQDGVLTEASRHRVVLPHA